MLIRSGRLEGEVALVTGAARNIGAATAFRLASEGAAVAVHFHSENSRADAEFVAQEIKTEGGRAIAIGGDIGSEEDVKRIIGAMAEAIGGPTILVNNAAASVVGAEPWHSLTISDWDRVLRTNIAGAFLCIRAAYPFMKKHGGGRIITMGSVRSPLGRPGNAHYTTSKSALEGMTRVLAREMGPDGITVNTVIVGAIRTPAESEYGDTSKIDEMLLDLQSIRRRGEPEDIAGIVAFLASNDGAFITGQSITVDGGWSMT